METVIFMNQTPGVMVARIGSGRLPEALPKIDLELVQVRLRCPIFPAIHPAVEAARRHTLDWALAHGLTRPDADRHRILRELLASALPARCWPSSTLEQLQLASDWIAFLSFYQHAVETAEIRDAETLSQLSAAEDRIVALLEGARPAAADPSRGVWGALVDAAADLRRRLAAQAPGRAWFRRFAGHSARYFEGVRWERLLDLEDPVPDLTAFHHRRSLGSAVYSCFDLAALFIPELEPAALEGSGVRTLEEMAANYVNWVDDLFNFDREMAEGKKANLVLILQEKLGLSVGEARDEMIDMCNREIDAFFEAAIELGPLGEMGPGVGAYVGALEAWMRGNLDSYGISRRWADPRLESQG